MPVKKTSSRSSTVRKHASEKRTPFLATAGIFGLLFAISLGWNIGLFLKLQNQEPTPVVAENTQNEKIDEAEEEEERELKNAIGARTIIDGKVWIRIDDPVFDLLMVTDPSCTTCLDTSETVNAFQRQFPTANIREISIDSEEGKRLREKGVDVVPSILFSKTFEKTSRFQELAQGGSFFPVLEEEFFELQTGGNKKLLDEKRLPPVQNVESSTTLVAYVDYLSDASQEFLQKTVKELYTEFGEEIKIDIRPLVFEAPSVYAASAVMCGADAATFPEKRETYALNLQEIVNNIPVLPEDASEEQQQEVSEKITEQFLQAVVTSFELEGKVADCVLRNDGFEAVQSAAKEGQSIGLGRAPAYFVEDLFLSDGSFENVKKALEEKK